MGIIIKNGIVYSSTDDCLKLSGGTMNGEIKYNYDTSSKNSVTAIRITKDGSVSSLIGSRTPSGVTGNINFSIRCGNAADEHQKAFNINGYNSEAFTVRFGDADFSFIEQNTFDVANGSTYSATLISTPYIVLIFPVMGLSGTGAATTENNPVFTATTMSATGFTFKNLTSYTKFRYVSLGVASPYT